MKKCPFCAEDIQEAAIKCRHCGSMLDGSTVPMPPKPAPKAPMDSGRRMLNWVGAVVLGCVVGCGSGWGFVEAFARWPGPRQDDIVVGAFFGLLIGGGIGFVYGGTKFGGGAKPSGS